MQKLPLEGIRVVDFTVAWAGYHITQWLAVMGAEVIKIESSLHPDMMRTFFAQDMTLVLGLNLSVSFAVLNYGKKGCTLNMNHPKAREVAKAIVKVSDIVAENFGGPVMERWGLGYSDLKKLKPDIIMYSGSGYGRTGPYKEFPAFAPIIDAFAGFTALNGYIGGEPRPFGVGGWTDLTAAHHGVFAILAALYHRSKTGEGQHIDLSMSEVAAALLPEAIIDYTMNDRVRGRLGNRDDIMAPHGCYRCRGEDKWVAIAVSSEEEWKAFCEVIGNPEWTRDERFRDGLNRWRNQEELDKLIQEWTLNHTPYEIMEMLQKAGVMAGPSSNTEELVQDHHLEERDFFVDIDHPEMGRVRLARLPWRLSDSPRGNYQHAPLLGEHNDYVFGELLNMSGEEIARLKEEQVIL
ncbi:MAG: CoA transferase [Dehalococcoidia bacterium]|nr:CoA transferase [Dehalococcoidia bacterium]